MEGADCIVALPGGLGTWDELWEIVCLKGIGERERYVGKSFSSFFVCLSMLLAAQEYVVALGSCYSRHPLRYSQEGACSLHLFCVSLKFIRF